MSNTTVKYTLTLTDLLTGKLDTADRTAKRLETTMSGLQRSINTVGAAIGISFGLNQVKSLISGVVEAGAKVEDARVGLTTLLRDSAAAGNVIKETMEDATKTPFAFEGLLQAKKALISANETAQGARQTVLDLANAIAATGGGDNELQRMVVNLQQIRNTGKATALDIKQFAYAGINVYQLLADATHKPLKAVQDMEVSYNLLKYALKKAHDEGGIYANGLENMANNTSVRVSNLGDSLFQLKVRVFDDLKPAIDSLLSVGMDMIKWLGDAWQWTLKNREMIFGLAKGVIAGVIAFRAYKIAIQASILWTKIQYASITLLGEGFLTANAATKLFAGGLQMIKTAMLNNPIGLAVTAIGLLTSAYFAFSGAAKDATRENEKLNKSLIETATLAGEKTEELIFQIADKYKYGLKNLKGAHYSIKEQNDLIAKDIQENIRMISEAAGSNGLDWSQLIQIKKLQNYKEVLAKGPKKITPGGDNFDLNTVKTKEAKGVTGTRQVNIKIDIGALIKDFKITTTTITQGADKIKEMVTQALLSAVNDSQVVAGQ